MNRFRKSPFPEPIPNSPTLPTSLPSPTIAANELDAVREFVSAARAASTTDAYHRDFSAFERWCRTRSHSSLPERPETLAAYLACEATRGIRPSTLARRAAAVASMHRLAGHVSPTESQLVCLTLAGIRRARGTAPVRKTPIGTEAIKAIFAATPDTIAGFVTAHSSCSVSREHFGAQSSSRLTSTTFKKRLTVESDATFELISEIVSIPGAKLLGPLSVRASDEERDLGGNFNDRTRAGRQQGAVQILDLA